MGHPAPGLPDPFACSGWVYVLLVVVSGVLVGAGILVLSLIGFAGFPLHNAEWSGVTLNALVGWHCCSVGRFS